MKIEQGLLFKYAFFIQFGGADETKSKEEDELFVWCAENINGQWITISNVTAFSRLKVGLTYHSKAVHKSSIPGYEYPPSKIYLTPEKIFAFEEEEDALAFKLQWM